MLTLFNWFAVRLGFQSAYRVFAYLVPVLALAAGAGAGAWAGYSLGRAPLQVELANHKATVAENQKLYAMAAARDLQAAQALGDALTVRLHEALRSTDQLERERNDAIRKATTGRTCFDSRALRVLDGAPGIRVDRPTRLPAPTSSAAGTHATAAAAAEQHSTDTEVGQWIVTAGARHEQCRARLDALIDWKPPTSPQHEVR